MWLLAFSQISVVLFFQNHPNSTDLSYFLRESQMDHRNRFAFNDVENSNKRELIRFKKEKFEKMFRRKLMYPGLLDHTILIYAFTLFPIFDMLTDVLNAGICDYNFVQV